MLLATVFLVFGAVQITHRQQLLAASVDLPGFHFELLLTHLTEMENRLQATLAEILPKRHLCSHQPGHGNGADLVHLYRSVSVVESVKNDDSAA
uniref:Uncharacterized protein n=1 Tax=Anopheles quadriannulatus TaxID=34691 RepID=A0A182WWG1_ANOQN